MSIKLIDKIRHYQGLSSDDKPDQAEINFSLEGSTYHEVDTGDVFIFHDGTWQPDLRLIATLRAV